MLEDSERSPYLDRQSIPLKKKAHAWTDSQSITGKPSVSVLLNNPCDKDHQSADFWKIPQQGPSVSLVLGENQFIQTVSPEKTHVWEKSSNVRTVGSIPDVYQVHTSNGFARGWAAAAAPDTVVMWAFHLNSRHLVRPFVHHAQRPDIPQPDHFHSRLNAACQNGGSHYRSRRPPHTQTAKPDGKSSTLYCRLQKREHICLWRTDIRMDLEVAP